MFRRLIKQRSPQFWALTSTTVSLLVYSSTQPTPVWNEGPLNVDTSPLITVAELNQHKAKDNCWVSIHGHVYDVTDFLESHPGGVDKLMRFAGKDASKGFRLQHPESYLDRFLDKEYYRGELVKETKKKTAPKRVERKSSMENKKEREIIISDDREAILELVKTHSKKIKRNQLKSKHNDTEPLIVYTEENKPSISQIFNLSDFETVAKNLLPPLVYSYLQSGTDNEYTVLENRNALGRIFFRPRCLVDVQNNTCSTEFLGCRSEVPFIVGSFTGSHLMNGKGDELMVVNTATDNGVIPIIAKNSQQPLENVALSNSSLFYQYSIDNKEELKNAANHLKDLHQRFPNIKAFFISIDTPIGGNLEHYKKLEAKQHQDSIHPSPQIQITNDFALTWNDLVDIKNKSQVPIILKGIQRVDDVVRCQKLGFQGALISNHDGRTLDTGLSPIEILFNVNKYYKGQKQDNFELFVEGGFRRGSDILKAICLGGIPAISKPILFSELYGKDGVQKAFDILKSEIIRDMKLLGVNHVDELNSSFLDCESLNFRVNTKDNDYLYGANYTTPPPPPFKNSDKLKFI